jgi:hypothetical protein
MHDENRQRPLQSGSETQAWHLVEPRSVPVGRGWGWIADGFRLFARSPGIWILNTVILLAILLVLSIIPVISMVVNILAPIFAGGFMQGCRDLDEGGRLEVAHVFAGFRQKAGRLAGLGAIYLLASVGIGLLVFAFVASSIDLGTLEGLEGGELGATAKLPELGPVVWLGLLIALGLAALLLMAYWFAPALIMLHDVRVFEAMKLSFRGCLRNIWPLLLYGIVLTVLMVLAVLPLLLGLLVLIPVLIASVYIGYRDIFIEQV